EKTDIGVGKIQMFTGLSKNSVLKAINELETARLISVERKSNTGYVKHVYRVVKEIEPLFSFEQLNTERLRTLKDRFHKLVMKMIKERKMDLTENLIK
ncbi:MAG: hypothetical protein AB1633_06040, partial [Elusimicrobiota bacterium]